MFEKFSATDVDSAGRGGEYTVQAGFGWTNGVALWVASKYGDVLVAPSCPPLLTAANTNSGTDTSPALRVEPAAASFLVILVTLLGSSVVFFF